LVHEIHEKDEKGRGGCVMHRGFLRPRASGKLILIIFIIIFIPSSHLSFLKHGGMNEERWG
jgi:hypothetical protein